MATIQLEAQVSAKELFKAVKQLDPNELEQFVGQVISLRAARTMPSLPHSESDLLIKINQGVSTDLKLRYDILIAKRQAETLSNDEHSELLQLTKEIEGIEARRVEYLSQLAQLRQTTLSSLMQNLGIRAPQYV